MLEAGSELFFENRIAATRQLVRSVVALRLGREISARCERSLPRPAIGECLAVYFENEGRFSRQTARVVAVSDSDGPGLDVTIELVGAPVVSDRRESRRVSVDVIHADFDDEIGCRVVDVNATGISVLATGRHVPGAIVEVALYVGGKRYTGRGAVKSSSTRQLGVNCYGIHVLETRGSSLVEAIRSIHADYVASPVV